MKTFLKKILVFCGIIAVVSLTVQNVSSTPTYAAPTRMNGQACNTFLGMTPWDCGFERNIDNQQTLINNIIVIATNILSDLTVIAGYLVLGYVIYGGYLYMFSSGDPAKAAAGKKTLTHTFIGLAIVLSAYTIFGAIRIAIVGQGNTIDNCVFEECVNSDTMIVNLIQWVLGMAGIVAILFIVIAGWGYITASGDPGKLQKAKTTILYALIGLVIVILADIITAFVSNLIRNANNGTEETEETSIVQTQLIANLNKENPHENF